MALNTFGVTATSVMDDNYPSSPSLSATSAPTAARVTEWINQEAAGIAGRLLVSDVDPSTTSIVAGTPGYYWCAKLLTNLVAVRVARVATGANAEVAATWQKEAEADFERLSTTGATALGDPALIAGSGNSPSNGPYTHISINQLTQDVSANMSDVVPQFRRSDIL